MDEAERVDIGGADDVTLGARDEPRDDRRDLGVLAVERILDETAEGGVIDPDRSSVDAEALASEAVG